MVCWNAPVLTHSNSGGKLEEIRLVCAKLRLHSLQFVLNLQKPSPCYLMYNTRLLLNIFNLILIENHTT